jgi:hypothetical protein
VIAAASHRVLLRQDRPCLTAGRFQGYIYAKDAQRFFVDGTVLAIEVFVCGLWIERPGRKRHNTTIPVTLWNHQPATVKVIIVVWMVFFLSYQAKLQQQVLVFNPCFLANARNWFPLMAHSPTPASYRTPVPNGLLHKDDSGLTPHNLPRIVA